LFGPIRQVPRLGWVVTDPALARAVLNDHEHFTLLGRCREAELTLKEALGSPR